MPAKFSKCASSPGSKIRTVSHGKSYLHVCIPRKGPSVGGEAKQKKAKRGK